MGRTRSISLALVLTACPLGPGTPPLFACAGDEQCAPPFRCVGGVCAGEAGGGAPDDPDGGRGGGAGGGAADDPRLSFQSPPIVPGGRCTPVVLELKGSTVDHQVNLAATPAGMNLFADAMCAQALSSRAFGRTTQSLVIYLRALTGQTYTVTAQSATVPVPASVFVPVLPIVRAGQCIMASGTSTANCMVAPAQQNLTETFLFYQASGEPANDLSSVSTRCTMGSTVSVQCERTGNVGDVLISWQTAEVPGLVVQRVDLPCNGTAARTLPLMRSVDPARSFATYAVKQSGTYFSANDAFAATLTGTGIDFEWAVACDELATITAQVAEWPGAVVARGTLTLGAGLDRAVSPMLATAQSAFTLATWTTLAGISDPLCASMLRVTEPSARTVSLQRSDAGTCAGPELPRAVYERVDLGPRGRVQQLTLAMPAGTHMVNAMVQPYDATRTLVFAGGQIGGQGLSIGEGQLATPSAVSDFAAVFRLATDQVFAERKSTRAAARWTVFVVELSP